MAMGLESSRYYTLGYPRLYIATNHKPLLSILGDRALDTAVNPRLLMIKERTLSWRFDIVYVPGNQQVAADTLSRRKCLAGLALMTVDAGGKQSLEESLSMVMRVQLQELKVTHLVGDPGLGEEEYRSLGCSLLP